MTLGMRCATSTNRIATPRTPSSSGTRFVTWVRRLIFQAVYTACLFCNGALGSNDTIERFPVGGRLAFDVEKGRPWVVCTHCGRWNLTPLEERWEAVEQCEREFRSSHVRASTANIGLARLASGLVLIRIGRP